MAWPKLTASDLETLGRFFLNEDVAKFYTQAEFYRWFSVAASDLAEKAGAVQLVLALETGALVRTVDVSALKVNFVEYVPTTGKPIMLTRIDPLKLGNFPITGTAPQYWYEYGSSIGIEPLPDAVYPIRVYVSDTAKMVLIADADFSSGWSGSGWALGDTAIHTGASSDLTYGTTLTEGSSYTLRLRITGIGTGGTVTPYFGSARGETISSDGYFTQTMTALSGSPSLILTAANDITIEELSLSVEVDYAAAGDQTALEDAWHPLIALFSVIQGLTKNKEAAPVSLLTSMYGAEMAYTKQNIVDIRPDGRDDITYR